MDAIERARLYLAKLPVAVSGAGGRTALFRAAKAVAFDFDLPEAAALTLLSEYNARCLPPFKECEMRKTLASAKTTCRGKRGRLTKPKPPYATSYRPRPPSDPPPRLSGPTLRQIMQARKEDYELSRKRAAWPALRNPSDTELQQIATLRGVRLEAVATLAARRLLMTCTYQGRECFTICGRKSTFRQIRHLDGSPISIHDRLEKTKALAGSRGSWIDETGAMDGATVIPAGFPVIIVEGVIGILEAVEARMRANDLSKRNVRAWIIARVSANHPATAPLLGSLKGRQVRIIADNDTCGRRSASELSVRIKAAGGFPEIVLPPVGKDLGESLKTFPADHPVWLELSTF